MRGESVEIGELRAADMREHGCNLLDGEHVDALDDLSAFGLRGRTDNLNVANQDYAKEIRVWKPGTVWLCAAGMEGPPAETAPVQQARAGFFHQLATRGAPQFLIRIARATRHHRPQAVRDDDHTLGADEGNHVDAAYLILRRQLAGQREAAKLDQLFPPARREDRGEPLFQLQLPTMHAFLG